MVALYDWGSNRRIELNLGPLFPTPYHLILQNCDIDFSLSLSLSYVHKCSIPFSVDDISKTMQQVDLADIDPPPLIRENSGFVFLHQRSEWWRNTMIPVLKPPCGWWAHLQVQKISSTCEYKSHSSISSLCIIYLIFFPNFPGKYAFCLMSGSINFSFPFYPFMEKG